MGESWQVIGDLFSNPPSRFTKHQPPSLPTPAFLDTAWANHSEKLHGPPYEREAPTPQSLNETSKIHSQVTHKIKTRPCEVPKSGLSRRSGLFFLISLQKLGVGKNRRHIDKSPQINQYIF